MRRIVISLSLAISGCSNAPQPRISAEPQASAPVQLNLVGAPESAAKATAPADEDQAAQEATERAERIARFELGAQKFEAEPTDASWAGPMQKVIDGEVSSQSAQIKGVVVKPTVCKQTTCMVEVYCDRGMREVTPVVTAAYRRLRDKGYPIGLSLATDPDSEPANGVATIGRYYMPFVR